MCIQVSWYSRAMELGTGKRPLHGLMGMVGMAYVSRGAGLCARG